MNNYIIKQGLGRSLFSEFLRLPKNIYTNDPHYVPPLTSEVKRTLDVQKNPYFSFAKQQRFLCYKDGIPAARAIVVIDSKEQDSAGRNVAFFGFFEAINDSEAVRQLFFAAEQFARLHGAESLEGPFNPNFYSELGLKVDRFDSTPHFFETYNPPYYSELLCNAGFCISRELKTYSHRGFPEAVLKRYTESELPQAETAFTVRHIRMNDLAHDLEQIREIYNDSFAGNQYYHDVSQEEYIYSAKYLRYITEPELTTIVESEGRSVAVVQFMQDVNPLLHRMGGHSGPLQFLKYERDRKKIRSAVLYAIGIKKAYQCSYVMGLLLRSSIKVMKSFDQVSTTWVSESNHVVIDVCSRLGFEADRSFSIFRKELPK